LTEIFTISPLPDHEVCDFCTAEPIHKLYACRNFMWLKRAMFPHESIGPWAACEICAGLVDAGRWIELTERALQQFKKTHGYSREEEQYFREQFRELHELFKDNMVKES
jgi:hypothetical protein